MMSDKPPEGIGRGGRGAALLAALKSQPRRPSQNIASEPVPTTEHKTIGRGAILQSILSQSRARAVPNVDDSEARQIVGRGLSATFSGHGRSLLKPVETFRSTSPIPASETSTSGSLLSSKFDELSIGKYSGNSGDVLKVEVNYVHLKVMGDKGIYEYHVSFSPSVDSKRMKHRLLNQQAVKDIIGSVKTFDGSKLYLPLKLPPLTDASVTMPTDNTLVTIHIKFIKKCQASDCLHLYNLLFRKVMNILKMTQVGRNFFDPKGCIPVPQHQLEVWPGYVTAVQEYEGGVMLNCDSSFRVLRTVTAYDIMHEVSKESKNMKENVMKALIGSVVLTRYNNKTYRVDDVAWDMNPTSTFKSHDGNEISFIDYYGRSYDLQIQDIAQPLLINKAKKTVKDMEEKLICLIPEFCFMTGLTDEMRNDFKVMKAISSCTRVTPEKRQYALQRFIENINNCPEAKACFSSWNLQLDIHPVALDGRLFRTETLCFGGNKKIQVDADWSRAVTSNHVLVPVDFENWAIVFTKKDSSKVVEFTKMLRLVCPSMGLRVQEPSRIEILNDRTETYCKALKEVINPMLQIVVVIFPTARDDRYSAIKKLCCVDIPIPSQVINSKTIGQPQKLRSVVQKIALQMNCKLGGELWSVHIPIKNLMICGLDTYHDAGKRQQSVLAFVASMNQNRTRWFSMTTMQKPGQEVGDNLKILFTSSLRKYFEINHHLPDTIVLFRDGVSDGEMDFVAKYEVEQLISCFKHFSAEYSPSLSVVIVQKRINTRIYAVQKEKGNKVLTNPPPGSVIDHSVTRKKWYDFFLVSQHVRQGTVSPTHYVVIYDTSVLKPDHMQKLTYKMTHLYYNWPGTVRVPAPCQYAHKLAYLVGQNLRKETHCDLSDRLFYL